MERITVDLAKDWLSVADVCDYLGVTAYVVTRLLPTRWAGVAEVVAGVIGLGVSLFLVVFGTLAAWDAFRLDALIFKQLVVPEWWLLAVTPLAGLLLVVESALHISGFRSPRDERGREPLARDGF